MEGQNQTCEQNEKETVPRGAGPKQGSGTAGQYHIGDLRGRDELRQDAAGNDVMQSHVKSINCLLCREWIRGGKRRRQKPKRGCGDPGQR